MTAAAIALYTLANIILLEKYTLRLGALAALAAPVAYLAALVLAYALVRQRADRLRSLLSGRTLAALTAALCAALAALQLSIDPYEVNVDRWSAIDGFLSNMLSGVSPYAAATHLDGRGSPFPAWQLFHLPFYALGDVGLSFMAGLALFAHSTFKLLGAPRATLALLMVALSPSFVYEVAVRSDLFTNFLVVCSAVIYMRVYGVDLERRMALTALVCALLVCTRVSAALPLLMLLFPQYVRQGAARMTLFPLLILAGCAAVFAPFVLWDCASLADTEVGPVALQMNKTSPTTDLAILALAIWQSLRWQDSTADYMTRTGAVLFGAVGLSFLAWTLTYDVWDFYASDYDITYFHQSLPFLVLGVLCGWRR